MRISSVGSGAEDSEGENSSDQSRCYLDKFTGQLELISHAGVSAIRNNAHSISPKTAGNYSIGLLPGMYSLIGCHDRQFDVHSARVTAIHTV